MHTGGCMARQKSVHGVKDPQNSLFSLAINRQAGRDLLTMMSEGVG